MTNAAATTGLLQKIIRSEHGRTTAAGLLAVGIIGIDLRSPQGMAAPVLYVAVVLVASLGRRRQTLVAATGCSFFTIFGFFLVASRAGSPLSLAMANRLFALLAIWMTAFLGLRLNRLAGELQRSEGRFRSFAENTLNIITVVDRDGTVRYENPAVRRVLGYEPGEIIGRSALEFVHPDDAPHVREMQQCLIENPQTTCSVEYRHLQKDGSWRFLESFGKNLLDDPHVAGLFIDSRDVTERKLAQERLVQAERLAAIGEAMAGLAHESRNALQRSQAALERLARRVKDRPEAVELITRIQIAQDDLHQLYETVREYATPVRLCVRTCHLGEIVKEAWNQLASMPSGRTARLREQPSPLDLQCEVDRFAARQVFRNIFENSLAAGDWPMQIEVEYTPAEMNGSPAVRVSIRDNGPGLDAEQRQRIFEPFFTTKIHGTGLGMAIARRLVEAHGGRIEVGSGNEPGAEIVITFPRRQT